MASVRAVTSAGNNFATTGTVITPTGQAGDLLAIAHIVDNDAPGLSSLTAPSGGGFVESVAYTVAYTPRLKLWTRPLDGAASSYTFGHDTTGGRSWALIALAVAEGDLDNPIDGAFAGRGSAMATTTLVGGGISPTQPDSLSLVFGAALRYNTADEGQQFYTPPAGWTERYDVGQQWLHPTAYTRGNLYAGSTGAGSASISVNMTGGYSSIHVAIRHKLTARSGQFLPFFGR